MPHLAPISSKRNLEEAYEKMYSTCVRGGRSTVPMPAISSHQAQLSCRCTRPTSCYSGRRRLGVPRLLHRLLFLHSSCCSSLTSPSSRFLCLGSHGAARVAASRPSQTVAAARLQVFPSTGSSPLLPEHAPWSSSMQVELSGEQGLLHRLLFPSLLLLLLPDLPLVSFSLHREPWRHPSCSFAAVHISMGTI